jgi:hypothetical protein
MESRGLKRQLQAFAFSFVKSRLFGHIDVATGNAASINCGASKLCLVKKSDPRDVRAIPVTHSKSSTEKCGFCKKLVTADVCSEPTSQDRDCTRFNTVYFFSLLLGFQHQKRAAALHSHFPNTPQYGVGSPSICTSRNRLVVNPRSHAQNSLFAEFHLTCNRCESIFRSKCMRRCVELRNDL